MQKKKKVERKKHPLSRPPCLTPIQDRKLWHTECGAANPRIVPAVWQNSPHGGQFLMFPKPVPEPEFSEIHKSSFSPFQTTLMKYVVRSSYLPLKFRLRSLVWQNFEALHPSDLLKNELFLFLLFFCVVALICQSYFDFNPPTRIFKMKCFCHRL